MRFCWGKASFDVDADAEDAALKKVDDDADDDVPFRQLRRRKRGARDEMRDMMMMMMMIRRDVMMNFCGGKILNCFYKNHHRHKKYTRHRGETRIGREWTAGARSASSPAPRWAARSAAPWARATGRTRRSRIKYACL